MAQPTPAPGFRTFLVLWLSQSVSLFGSALTLFAISIWLMQVRYPAADQRPALAGALALLGLAGTLPAVIGAPLAGAWADRHDRKRTMLVTNIGLGLLTSILVGLIAAGRLEVWSLVLLELGLATFGAFHMAAFDTSYVMLVSQEQLPRANAMTQTAMALSGILSPALAAGIIAMVGLAHGATVAIGLDALTFFVAAATLLFLDVPSPAATEGPVRRGSLLADVKEGAAFIRRRPGLLWLLACFTVANLVVGPSLTLAPLVLKFNLQADWSSRGLSFESALALLNSLGSAGGVVLGILLSMWGGLKRQRVLGVVVPMAVAGAATVWFGTTGLLYAAAANTFIIRGHFPVVGAHSNAIWQIMTPREKQGRVFAVRRVIAQGSAPLATAFAGWAGGHFNPGTVVAVLGAVMMLFSIAQLFNPTLRGVEEQELRDSSHIGGVEEELA